MFYYSRTSIEVGAWWARKSRTSIEAIGGEKVNVNLSAGGECGGLNYPLPLNLNLKKVHGSRPTTAHHEGTVKVANFTFSIVSNKAVVEVDPFEKFQATLNKILFGENTDLERETAEPKDEEIDVLAHYPTGKIMRAEMFQNKGGVHIPTSEWLHQGHCYLNTNIKDYMQTAVNAFTIFLEGNLDDVLRMPPTYILRSARTIAMMRVSREKLVATWTVIKGDLQPEEITYQTLEYYRPLFKYVNGREMARLNLDDERILSYVGTHSDLDRHQVGVIASRYIQRNKNWREAKYLNLMNNLLCGVPMMFMRKIPENVYLQLSHQLFYHIKACDPLQRRFYLAMMTRTQVLGKSNSWSARDVARLGLLLTEVDGTELSAISPEAIAGITSQVMMEMLPHNLRQLTKMQLRYLNQKPLNILIKKVNLYEDELRILNAAVRANKLFNFNFILSLVIVMKIRYSC